MPPLKNAYIHRV